MAKIRSYLKMEQIVDNFISTMDMDLDMSIHLLNADTDAQLYDWDYLTHSKVIKGIYAVYHEQKQDEWRKKE